MKYLIITTICLFSLFNLSSQNKEILGDTAFWYRQNRPLAEEIKLQDFSTSQQEFNFRFQNFGQVVEIWKDKDSIGGVLTNYIFRIKKFGNGKTIFKKTVIDPNVARSIYHIINESKILTVPTDKKIEGWAHGYDGIEYIIEYANDKEYWFKNYWTPTAQDSLREALVVQDFVNRISDTLKLKDAYNAFENKIPHRGCYHSGGNIQTCYPSDRFSLGYFGSTRLPIGYAATYYMPRLANLKTIVILEILHNFDTQDNYNFVANIWKNRLFSREGKSKFNDQLNYEYRRRELDFVTEDVTYQNHKFIYNIGLKPIAVGLGVNYQFGNENRAGLTFSLGKSFSKPRIDIWANASIFEDQFDYQIQINKNIDLKNNIVPWLTVGLYNENFISYNDIGFFATVSF